MYLFCLGLFLTGLSTTINAYQLSDAEIAIWMTYDQVDPSLCQTDNSPICTDCKMSALCLKIGGVFVAYGSPCADNEICDGNTCSSSPVSTAGRGCLCPPSNTGSTNIKDPYSDSHYTLCVGATPYYIDCGTLKYVEAANGCADVPDPDPCTETGIFPVAYDCSYYSICTSVGVQPLLQKCDVNLYFNPDSKTCVSKPTVPFVCTQTGAFRDPINCSTYNVCNGNTILATETCPCDEIFSDQTKGCIPTDGSCTDLDYCLF